MNSTYPSQATLGYESVAAQPGDVPPSLGFFQRPAVQNFLPFLTSMTAHAVVVILAMTLLAVAEVITIPSARHQEQVIAAEGTISEVEANGGGVPQLLPSDPFRQYMQDQHTENTRPDGTASSPGPSLQPGADGGGNGDGQVVELPAPGGRSGGGQGGQFGLGAGNGGNGGDGRGGPLAQFGTPSAPIGPQGVVFGYGGNARKIVFICDATGTMINRLSQLKMELRRAIENLRPMQSFNVVFYTDGGKVLLADRNGLMLANAENKRAALRWLEDVTANGTTDPIPAIETAFRLHPTADLVYFLSDGEFNNLRSYDEVAAAVWKGRASNTRCKVNTILFETYDRQAEETMERIAKENLGVYRYVREDDLKSAD